MDYGMISAGEYFNSVSSQNFMTLKHERINESEIVLAEIDVKNENIMDLWLDENNIPVVSCYGGVFDGLYVLNGSKCYGPYKTARHYGLIRTFPFFFKLFRKKWVLVEKDGSSHIFNKIENIELSSKNNQFACSVLIEDQWYVYDGNNVLGEFDDKPYISFSPLGELFFTGILNDKWYVYNGSKVLGEFDDRPYVDFSPLGEPFFEGVIDDQTYIYYRRKKFGPYDSVEDLYFLDDGTLFFIALEDNYYYVYRGGLLSHDYGNIYSENIKHFYASDNKILADGKLYAFREDDLWYVHNPYDNSDLGPFDNVKAVMVSPTKKLLLHVEKNGGECLLYENRRFGPFERLSVCEQWFELTGEIIDCYKRKDAGYYLFLGKEEIRTVGGLSQMIVSPDGRRFCYTINEKRYSDAYLIDGDKKFGPFDSINNIEFSDDGKHLIISVTMQNEHYVYLDDKKFGPFPYNASIQFTDDGSAVSYDSKIIIDDKEYLGVVYKGKALYVNDGKIIIQDDAPANEYTDKNAVIDKTIDKTDVRHDQQQEPSITTAHFDKQLLLEKDNLTQQSGEQRVSVDPKTVSTEVQQQSHPECNECIDMPLLSPAMERTLCLFRLYDQQHIIYDAPAHCKNAYYKALAFFTQKASQLSGYEEFFTACKNLWSITECGNMRMKNTFAHLNKVDKKRHSGFFGFMKKPIYARKYLYALIIEAAYILSFANKFNFTELISEVEQFCKVPENIKNWLQEYFSLLFAKDIQTHSLIDYVQNANIKHMADTVKHITEHLLEIKAYETLPVFNISVIATMSAGKSTFVNALLGNEIFPEANEACTAKITSIYDNDFYHRTVGVGLHNGEIKEVSNNLSNEDLIKWNTNKTFDRIILEGNLDNITNTEKIVAVHDTPGTNNSGDTNHHDITFEFLQKHTMDAIIYMANVEHLATTDEKELLTELYNTIISIKNIPVIFVLNKSDSIDTEKENIFDMCRIFKDELISIGFTPDSFIIPTSAKAARLFKMALNNKADTFTGKEKKDFMSAYELLSDNSIITPILNHDMQQYKVNDETITIAQRSFSKQNIVRALYNTGFPNLEAILEAVAVNDNTQLTNYKNILGGIK